MSKEKGFFNIPILYLELMGLWPPDLITRNSLRNLYIIYRRFVTIFYFVYTTSLTTELVRLIVLNKPSRKITGSAALVVTVLVACVKAVIYQKHKVPYMCMSCIKEENDILKSNDDELQNTYRVALKWNRYLSTGVILMSTFSVGFLGFNAFLYLNRHGVQGWDFENVAFMYELYFPFNKTEHFTFIAVYNIYVGILGIFLYVAVQTTFYSLIIFTALRFRLLQIRLRQFHTFTKEFNGDVVFTIKTFIKIYQDLARFVETLNEATKYVMLMEFLLNSVNVASVLFQIITMQSLLELAFPIFYLSLLIMQIFVLGWTSNDIKLQSLGIADAIYDSPWYQQDEAAKKLLHVMLLRAQKPLVLTIGPFNPMTTETALMTMKAAYSYVTLMTKTYD